MPTQINVMFDNFNIQTWKTFLVSFKMYTWFIERKKKHTKQANSPPPPPPPPPQKKNKTKQKAIYLWK